MKNLMNVFRHVVPCAVLLIAAAVLAGETPLRIHIISGCKEYNSDQSLHTYAAHLEAKLGARVTGSWVSDGATVLPNADQIKDADLLIVFARRLNLDEKYLPPIRQHWDQGKPCLGIRTASHAFQAADIAVFDRQVLGGNYLGHYANEPVQVANVPTERNHPVLKGVGPFTSRRLYKAGELAKDTTVLQRGTIDASTTQPVTWVHEYHGGRMFYTSLGVPEDFANPNFIRLLDNAVSWTTQTQPTAGTTATAETGTSSTAPTGDYLVYFGTYTGPKSKGIYVSRLDPKTGEVTEPELAATTTNPSFLAVHPNEQYLYAVGEVWNGSQKGSVIAYRIAPQTGKLTELNQQSSGGVGPCHLNVDASGHCLLVANYGGGSIAVLPIQEDGRLGEATAFVQHAGSSVNPQRQKGPHAHGIYPDPANRFVFVPDLGLDKVMSYRLDAAQGTLTPNHPPFTPIKPGSGPRHFTFSPDGKFAYVISEMASTITAFRYDASRGALEEIQTISTLPPDFTGNNSTTAEIEMHPSGKFLYGSNRGHDSIAVFAVDPPTGRLRWIENVSTQGKTPRGFGIDPTGHWLLAANQGSDNAVVFRLDETTGRLTPTGQILRVGAPVCVKFVPVK